MVVIAAVAFYGVVLGLSMRPAIRAAVFAPLSVAAVQYGVMVAARQMLPRPGVESLAWTIQHYAGAEARDLIPTTLTAAITASVMALVMAMMRSGEQRGRRRGR
jgi:hypothetical protein